jgi:tellurite resistance protein
MLLDHITHNQARAALGAMRAVAEASGGLHPNEASWLSVCARAFGTDDDVSRIEPCTVEHVLLSFDSPIERERVLQCMVLMALMDGHADVAEALLIEHFARVLSVREERVKSLRELAEGRLTRMFLGLAWQSYGHAEWVRLLRTDAPRGAWKMVGGLMSGPADMATASRFRALQSYDSETLGRIYSDWILSRGYPVSGEPGGVPESGVWPDLVRILAGYTADADGEVQTSALIAGFRQDDPFFWLFTTALQFHLGLRLSPYTPGGQRGHFAPERVAHAYTRGRKVVCDLSQHWDFWPTLKLPLKQAQRELGFCS